MKLRTVIIILWWIMLLVILGAVFPLAAALFILTTAITLVLRPGLVRTALSGRRRPNPRVTGGSSVSGEIRGQTGTPTINVIGNNNTITINSTDYTPGNRPLPPWALAPGRLVDVGAGETIRRIGNPYDPNSGPVFGCRNCEWHRIMVDGNPIGNRVFTEHVFDDHCIYANAPYGPVTRFANRTKETDDERREREWLAGKDIIDAAKNIVIPGDRPQLDARLRATAMELECAICGVEFIDHGTADHAWEEIQEAGFE